MDESEMLSCRQMVELTTDHSEGALAPYDQLRWERHMELCPGCVAHAGAYEVTVGLVARLPDEPLSVRLEESILALHRRWSAGVRT